MSTHWSTLKPSDILTREDNSRLRQRSDLWGFWLLAHCWGLIVAAMFLYGFYPSFLTFVLAVTIIGGRQLGLAILMHEGAHGLLFKSRWLNETLTKWLAAGPMSIDMGEYRSRHMAHHRFTRTDRDPENYLYTPFPVAVGSMARKILRDLTGIAFVRTQLGLFLHLWGEKPGRVKRLWRFYNGGLISNTVLLGAFILMGRADLYLQLWLVPMATTHMFFLRIRNISEHASVIDLEDPLQNSRTTLANWAERLTFAPYYVNYHIEHHMMPYIPCYRLPQLHKILARQGVTERMNIEKGYWRIVRLNTLAEPDVSR